MPQVKILYRATQRLESYMYSVDIKTKVQLQYRLIILKL